MNGDNQNVIDAASEMLAHVRVPTDAQLAAIEEYRLSKPGLLRLHVSLGTEDATPEQLVDELRKVDAQVEAYEALPEEWKLRWQVHHYEQLMNEVVKLASVNVMEFLDTPHPALSRLSEIRMALEFCSATHVFDAVEYYKSNAPNHSDHIGGR